MDFIASRDALVQALTNVAGVVERKAQNNILSAVLLTVEDGQLRYVGSDKMLTLRGSLPVNVQRPGTTAIDAATLLTTVKSLPGDTVRLTLEDAQRVDVTSGAALFRLSAQNGGDYPVPPPLDQSRSMHVAVDTLRRLLDQTLFAVASEDNRYNLHGANFEQVSAADGSPLLRVVTTDGNRLSWSQGPFVGDFAVPRRSLVPRKGLAEVRRLLDGTSEDVEIAFGERACLFRVGDCSLHMRLIEADFPDYRQVLPSGFKRRVALDTAELNDALKRVLIFASDSSRSIKCIIGESMMTLTSRKLDAGESKEEIRADLQGEPVVMGFNGRYLQDVVVAVGSDRMVMELGETLAPCVVRNPDSVDCLFVVMPVRLD